ncbi:Dyp-type peroxidase [Microbacterium dextranolyticum]|uniref:Iron-dependent peroxidase n=1 Tax=Microbacterium dextranolyticum TaxID=36806 RepID=A0A9W6HJC8_9MICO|nr:Dyp-type peroxidase [Microbacterium dextranolyticum]MBM7462022.1 dye decolorizing peroxidase [Microbacterium dextranolyticum]GLJ94266.1 iron-dependent peroxidase [Microbacterium dextranolyticum]
MSAVDDRGHPADADESDSTHAPERALSRRALLFGAGATAGLIAGAAGGTGIALAASRGTDPAAAPAPSGTATAAVPGAPVVAAGLHQGGIAAPAMPQQHCIVAIGDLTLADLRGTLTALGTQILRATDAAAPLTDLTPGGVGDTTVTIGLGPRALAATGHPDLAGVVALPDFAGDPALSPERRGGDILLSVNASDPVVLEPILHSLTALLPGFALRWSDFGYRGAVEGTATRNPFGYLDGIKVPHGPAEFDENVWIASGPLAGGTVCVIRRFALAVDAFRQLAPDARDATVGRSQVSGAPLSGGIVTDDVDLTAKSPNGDLLVPARSHARAAHPSFTGSALMLRRSYSYRASAADQGHMFISYQADVQTFARTQLRLDEIDDMMRFATPTATAAFAVLPGFSASSPLGSTLF